MKIGLLTGGGDAPGLNGIIESFSRTLLKSGHEIIGFRDGFDGVFAEETHNIQLSELEGLHSRAGTLLGTSNKTRVQGREAEFIQAIKKTGISGLVAAGGDGTFEALSFLKGALPIIGVPKTIDNDLHGTDITFGFDTACSVIAESVDALRATADAHKRILIVEAMGRTAGWIALGGGLASYADAILIPERPFEKEKLLSFLKEKQAEGRRGMVLVISESAHVKGETPDVAFHVKNSPVSERYGGISQKLARWIEEELSWEARAVVPGHLQRSRPPTTTDRFLTAMMGVEAAKMVLENAWHQMVVYKSGRVQRAPISVVAHGARVIPQDHPWVRVAQSLGIFI